MLERAGRLSLLVVALLMTLPASSPGAAGTGATLEVASFRSDSSFRYDATLEVSGPGTSFHGSVADAVVIDVHRTALRMLLDGQAIDTLTLQGTHVPLPGLDFVSRVEAVKGSDASAGGEVTTIHVAMVDGSVVQMDTERLGHANASADPAVSQWVLGTRSERLYGAPSGSFMHGVWPGRSLYARGTDPASGPGEPLQYTWKGSVEDDPVVAVEWKWPVFADELATACPSPAPAGHPYGAIDASLLPGETQRVINDADRGQDRSMIASEPPPEVAHVRVWIDVRLPVPRGVTCHLTTQNGHSVTLSYRLAARDEGSDAIPIALHPRDTPSLPPRTTLVPNPIDNGTPPESGVLLEFPLARAVSDVREQSTENGTGLVRAFWNDVHVQEATLSTRVANDPLSSTVRPLARPPTTFEPGTVPGDSAHLKATWNLTLRNAGGEWARAQGEFRSYTYGGEERQIFDSRLIAPRWDNAKPPPTRMGHIDVHLANVLGQESTTYEAWRDRGGSLSYFGATDEAPARYTVRLASSSATTVTHRATDGALMSRDSLENRSGASAAPSPTGRPPVEGPLDAEVQGLVQVGASMPPVDWEEVAVVVVTAVLSVSALLAASWNRLPRWFWLPLYAKVHRDRLLDHRARRDIVSYLEANPGATFQEIRAASALASGTTTHHLRTLERGEVLTSIQSGRRRCYFLRGRESARERAEIAALSSGSAKRLFALIQRRPGIRQREAAAALGVTTTAVIFHAKRLEAAGAVRRRKHGREVAYIPNPQPPGTAAP